MIRPLVGGTIPATALNSVVLPAPLGPIMARRWPRGTDRLTPSTARSASNANTASVSVRIGSGTNIFPVAHHRLSEQITPFDNAIRDTRSADIGPRFVFSD